MSLFFPLASFLFGCSEYKIGALASDTASTQVNKSPSDIVRSCLPPTQPTFAPLSTDDGNYISTFATVWDNYITDTDTAFNTSSTSRDDLITAPVVTIFSIRHKPSEANSILVSGQQVHIIPGDYTSVMHGASPDTSVDIVEASGYFIDADVANQPQQLSCYFSEELTAFDHIFYSVAFYFGPGSPPSYRNWQDENTDALPHEAATTAKILWTQNSDSSSGDHDVLENISTTSLTWQRHESSIWSVGMENSVEGNARIEINDIASDIRSTVDDLSEAGGTTTPHDSLSGYEFTTNLCLCANNVCECGY